MYWCFLLCRAALEFSQPYLLEQQFIKLQLGKEHNSVCGVCCADSANAATTLFISPGETGMAPLGLSFSCVQFQKEHSRELGLSVARLYFLLFLWYCVCVSDCVFPWPHLHVYGCQRTTWRSRSSPSTMWGPGIGTQVVKLCDMYLYLLSQPACS